MSSVTERNLLCSWKEIASYMGLGVRTVQRYEQHLGLPVHRLTGNLRSSVSGFTDEIDTWRATTGAHPIGRAEWEQAMKEIEDLRSEIRRLRETTEELGKRIESDAHNELRRDTTLENRSSQSDLAS